MSVNRTELVQAIAAKAGLTNTAADAALKAFQEVLVEQLSAGESVTIPGLFAVSRASAPPAPASTRRPASRWTSRPATG